jgi:hypothetical protein
MSKLERLSHSLVSYWELRPGAQLGSSPEVLSNIRLGWKGLARTYCLAYLTKASVTKKKGFISLKPNFVVTKLFSFVTDS